MREDQRPMDDRDIVFRIETGVPIDTRSATICGSLVQGGVLFIMAAVGFIVATMQLETSALAPAPYAAFAMLLLWVMAGRSMTMAWRWVTFFLLTLAVSLSAMYLASYNSAEWSGPILVFVTVLLFALVIRLNLSAVGLVPGSLVAQIVVNALAFAAAVGVWHASPLTAEVTLPVLAAAYVAMLFSSAASVATHAEAERTAAARFNSATPCLFVAMAPFERLLDVF